MNSIRRNLTLRLLVGTSLLLIVGSSIICVLVWSLLLDSFDDNLLTKAKSISALTTREGRRIESEFHENTMPEYSAEEDPEYFQITFQDGTVINRSESMEDFEPPIPSLGDQLEKFGNIELGDGDFGRYVLIRTKPIKEEEVDEKNEVEEDEIIFDIPETVDAESATVTIFAARGREEFDEMIGFIFLIIGGIDILVLAGIYLVVKSSVRKGLGPLDQINEQIAKIEPESIEGRILIKSPPTELSSIINALNELLDRMKTVITRERRFTSDVAHELRTPVAELRTACEVGLLSPEDTESTAEFFTDIGDIAKQMEKVVSNLLSLSRWDQEQTALNIEKVELNPILSKSWSYWSKEAQEKGIKLDSDIDAHTRIATDREKFEMIIKNLFENAVAYSSPGSQIRCRLEPGNPSLILCIENQATDLCKEDLVHMFDRFWRKESARSEVNHSGLGLSIVKALADMLDISIETELLNDKWFRVRLKIRV